MRALSLLGSGRNAGHRLLVGGAPPAAAKHPGTGALRGRVVEHASNDDGRRGRDALAQQGLGQRAPSSAERDEPRGPTNPVPRPVPGLLVHGHAAAVHAHERRRASGARMLRTGPRRRKTQRPRDRTAGTWILPRPAGVARGDRPGPLEVDAGPDAVGPRRPAGGERRRTPPAAGTRAVAASHATRDDAVRQSAPAKPGLLRPGQFVTRRSVEPAGFVLQEDGGVP